MIDQSNEGARLAASAWHQSCNAIAMNDDSAMAYLAAAVRLAGVDRFYTRRVLQRCQRGEISVTGAAELLMAAAESGGGPADGAGIRRWLPDTLT